MFSATILDSKWSDITNAILLLEGTPVTTRGRFFSAFDKEH
jgi:hypothetical protein